MLKNKWNLNKIYQYDYIKINTQLYVCGSSYALMNFYWKIRSHQKKGTIPPYKLFKLRIPSTLGKKDNNIKIKFSKRARVEGSPFP